MASTLAGPPGALFDVVESCARERGQVIAAIDAIEDCASEPGTSAVLPRVLCYADLADAALRVASVLAQRVETRSGAIATYLRRGNDWYCVFLAAAKLKLAVAALSTDLRDKDMERRRNAEMISMARPSVVVVSASHGESDMEVLATAPRVTFSELWRASQALPQDFAVGEHPGGDGTLCYCYTGGTTKASRCVRVTHKMALHEVATYPHVVNLKPTDRILQQHSVYWAASAYGEIDIALAFKCALVFCDVGDADSVASAIRENQVTCAGLVPSVLTTLDPGSLPDLRVVFTWGEALSARTAQEWTQRAKVVDLLISTECWLSLYAVWGPSGGRPPFQSVPGTRVRLGDGSEGEGTATGELLVAGPMVMSGYTDDELNTGAFLRDKDGTCWYRTRDRLERQGDGFVFAGRADDLVKVGGVWVDLADVQRRLEEHEGVAEAALVGGRHAFVALKAPLQPGTLPGLRRLLPADFSLAALPHLPRHAATDKVDRAGLLSKAGGEGFATELQLKDAEGCQRHFKRLSRWYLPLCGLGLPAVAQAAWTLPSRLHELAADGSGSNWEVVMGVGSLLLSVGTTLLWEACWRGGACTYMALVPWHLQWERFSFTTTWLPGGVWGGIILLGMALPGPRTAAVFTAPGLWLAWSRGRLLSWPVIAGFGFPLWIAEHGAWWARVGLRGSLRWYGTCLQVPLQPAIDCVVKASNSVRNRLQQTQRCANCKGAFPITGGHVYEEDGLWYCEACWDYYHKHTQCSQCQEWSVHCQTAPDGTWRCRRCMKWRENSEEQQKQQQQGWQSNRLSSGERPQQNNIHEFTFSPAMSAVISGQPAAARCSSTGGTDSVVECAGPPGSGACQTPQDDTLDTSPTTERCLEWKLIERVTGWTFPNREAPIAGLDSLRVTKVITALRRETGRRVPQSLIRRCTTLGDLLQEVQRLPVEPQVDVVAKQQLVPARQEWATWGMMWKSKCAWCLHRDQPLSEETLRQALAGLVERHPSLSAKLVDPLPLYSATQQAFTMYQLWQRHGFALAGPGIWSPWLSKLSGHLTTLTRASFRAAWPRAGVQPQAELPLLVVPHSQSMNEAKRSAGYLKFKPPWQAALATYGQGDTLEGAIVVVQVSHMFSDGFSVVPILSDLGHLIAQAEGQVLPPLAPVPSAMAVLEQRLMRTIDADDSLKDLVSPEPLDKPWMREWLPVFSPVEERLVLALKRASRDLGISVEILLLTTISVGLCYLEQRGTVTLVMVVPQRDGPAESELVGLFADFRGLQVACDGMSIAGLALQLHRTIKDRLWTTLGLANQYDWPFVNFQWTEMERHHGLSQVNELSQWTERLRNPIGIVIEQSDVNTWRLRTSFDKVRYGPAARDRFYAGLTVALEAFLLDPLRQPWPQPEAVS